MKEYIGRESVLKCIEEDGHDGEYDLGYWPHNVYFQDIIKAIPASDVVPVVRCKDCKYTKRDGSEDAAIYCEKWDRWEMPEDAYCYLGRKI